MCGEPSDPAERPGIYKRFSDVPERHRLESFQARYDGGDLWGEFLIEVFFPRYNSYQTSRKRAEPDEHGVTCWTSKVDIMRSRGRLTSSCGVPDSWMT